MEHYKELGGGKMKEELLKNLSGILDYVKQGADFIKEQAPLFIQEFITYKMWTYSFWIIMSIVVSIICVFVFKKSHKRFEDSSSYEAEQYFMLMGVSLLIIGAMLIPFCYCTTELIKLYFAPRYFLMEHLLSLVK